MEGKLEKTIRFDADWIREYCKLIGDNNNVHDSEYMHGQVEIFKGMKRCRQAIVPGFMVLSGFGDMLVDSFQGGANCLDVHMGAFLCEEDKAILKVLPIKEKENRLAVFADNLDAFTSRKVSSTLTSADASYFGVKDPYAVSIPVSFDNIEKFGRLMGIEHKSVRDTLFGLSLISQAVLHRIRNPVYDVEKELHKSFCQETDRTKRVLPVYQAIRAFLPSRDQLRIQSGNLEFSIVGRKGSEKRDYYFGVWCKQGNFPILSANLDLVTVKELGLVKGARYSTIDNGS